jgi:hypothetical protein
MPRDSATHDDFRDVGHYSPPVDFRDYEEDDPDICDVCDDRSECDDCPAKPRVR